MEAKEITHEKIIGPLVEKEKESNLPIIKSENGNVKEVKIVYFYSESKVLENKKIIEAIITNGMDRKINFDKGLKESYCNTDGGYKLASGEPKIFLKSATSDQSVNLEDFDVIVFDGACSEELLKNLRQKLETIKIEKFVGSVIDRALEPYEGGPMTRFEYHYDSPPSYVPEAIAVFVRETDKKIEEGKTTYEKHKGKILGSLMIATLGLELWRRWFFGGNKTNEKEKSQVLKKMVESNRKDEDSARQQ